MSRSMRKTPIVGFTTADSEKTDKRVANRRLRRRVRQLLDEHSDVLPHVREVFNAHDMSKDGKGWFDPKRFPQYMRK